jgi:signal transduction histidine kinase
VTDTRALPFTRSDDDRVLAGVCGGVASALVVDATLVRFAFALLALAGGAGILLYFALWAYGSSPSPRIGQALIALSAASFLLALGLSGAAVIGAGLLVAGIAVVLARGGSLRPGGRLPALGIALSVAGAVTLLDHVATSNSSLIGPGALAGALLLVFAPWLWQLYRQRTEQIRLQERADVAARVHDSVLQTLALVQRHAGDEVRVSSIARRQERELRRWLYGSGFGDGTTLDDALAEAAADVEELHGVRIELASAGHVHLDAEIEQLVLAAREAMANAAKFAGAGEISVYAESDAFGVAVFIRDRGAGFDRATVPADRRGLTESIEGRLARAGGVATIRSAPGEGTEIELTMPRDP